MNIAVIPARGGSKRIPRKNIKPFCGKPMIAWSIEAAKKSGCFEKIVVSTDDAEIADIARQFGAEVPFVRSEALSDDFAGTEAVVVDAINQLQQQQWVFAHTCCIYPTAPLLMPAALQQGLALLENEHTDFAFSATTFDYPIQRALRQTASGHVAMFYPQYRDSRSQDLEPALHDAGQFYWGKTAAWLAEQPLFGERSVPVKLPRMRVQDIDTPEDWQVAELQFKLLQAME